MIHNRYRQRGGEDESVRLEVELLRNAGHDVEEYTASNDEIGATPAAALRAAWNPRSHRVVTARIATFRPDVVHIQNFFAAVSPSVHYAATAAGVPVVQTLRNYRLVCANASLFRKGSTCHACVGRSIPWRGVWNACYRDSTMMSAALVGSIAAHNLAGTWRTRVGCYIALSNYAKSVFMRAGLAEARLVVKPNFLSPAPAVRDSPGEWYQYVGRLAPEKGVSTLLRAVAMLPSARLRLVGDGPIRSSLTVEARRLGVSDRVEFTGPREHTETVEMMRSAKAVIVPSEWDEPFGRVIIEAYACGVPVVGSRRGGITELVRDGVTGLQFSAGEVTDLASKIAVFERDPGFGVAAGLAARREFESRFTPEVNLQILLDAYRIAKEETEAYRRGASPVDITRATC